MHKIIYVSLDNRPCNYYYPQLLCKITDDMQLSVPPLELMGKCKQAGDTDAIWQWLYQEAADADYAILSVDTLIYGNIIHSRIHNRSLEQIDHYIAGFKKLKAINADLHIEAFNLVARVAAYNDSFEDPDYWDTYGELIWKYGWLEDRINRNLSSEAEKKEFEIIKGTVPVDILNDFLTRRKKDSYVNRCCVDLTSDGIFDHLVIPKDDTAEFGYAATDQKMLSNYIFNKDVMDKVMIYPGADEVGSVLLARVFHDIHNWNPRIYVRYSSALGPSIIPRYEDRPLSEAIKSQITSLGGIVVENSADSDFLFAVHSPGKIMEECCTQANKDLSYSTHCCLSEFFNYIKYYKQIQDKPVALADVAFSNGADIEMMKLAKKSGILDIICAYSGWNTSENTNGMCLAHASIYSYYDQKGISVESKLASEEFLARKIIEDYTFQAQTMLYMIEYIPEHYNGCSARYCSEIKDQAAACSGQVLQSKIKEEFNNSMFGKTISLDSFYLPWDRIQELGFQLHLL